MKVIYIAGPYRDERGEWWIRENIRDAEDAALYVWQHGAVALCPHKNTAFFGGAPKTKDQMWLEGDLELLERCDALFAIDGWERSEGARQEIDFANRLGIPVLYDFREVSTFIGGDDDKV